MVLKDPLRFSPEAAPYVNVAAGLGEGYLDTFKSLFRDFYSWIRAGKPMDIAHATFPTFYTGLCELEIVDAVLKSASSNTWVDVTYSSSFGNGYL